MEPKGNTVSVKFISSRFSLPLFILSRNQIKQSKFNKFTTYIKKKSVLYNKCFAKGFENASLQHPWHTTGKQFSPSISENHSWSIVKKWNPKPTKKTCQLPPNLYDVNKIPYEAKRGIGGAHWPKIRVHQSKSRPYIPQHHADFYSLSENKKLSTSCNRNKGRFLTNARERRPTTRCMINCNTTCYRNSSDPGPATYRPVPINEISKKSLSLPTPHLFYYSSSVPQKKNAIHNAHTSFTAAPGRYETRYQKSCPCPSGLVHYPQINTLIDKESRQKFRGLAREKIRAQNYTSPDWRHVKGHGFRYLFMGYKPEQSKHFSEQNAKAQKSIKLYPDSKYIGIINNPARAPLTFRSSPISSPEPRIRFNCIPKIITRRHTRANKKTAFNSCQERFQDLFRLPIAAFKQRALPLERQLRNRPVMYKRPPEIKSKLTEIPKRMLPTYVPALRKKMFKFQPLPQAKMLVTENETNTKVVSSEGFYLRCLEAKIFFKADLNT